MLRFLLALAARAGKAEKWGFPMCPQRPGQPVFRVITQLLQESVFLAKTHSNQTDKK